jgi:hypothetical protein
VILPRIVSPLRTNVKTPAVRKSPHIPQKVSTPLINTPKTLTFPLEHLTILSYTFGADLWQLRILKHRSSVIGLL